MKSVPTAILFAIALAIAPAVVAAPAQPGSCRATADQITAATGARLDHISFSGRFAVLLHHDIDRLSVSCARGDGPLAIEGDLRNAYPRPGFYDTLAKAAAGFAGQKASIVEAALRQCYRAAIDSDDEVGLVQTKSFGVECHAYLREDGKLIMIVTPAATAAAAPIRYPRAPTPVPGARIGPVE